MSFAPAAPDQAVAVFGDALPKARAYADMLADAGVVRGLIGPREVPRLWERHLLNSAALAGGVSADATVVDVGSGAGLPGIPLALARHDLRITLVEPLLRRADFLTEAVDALDLGDRVEVVRARAEALHGTRAFDVVTARAVAPLPRLLEWTLPLAGPGGSVIALKGESAAAELHAAGPAVTRLGGQLAEVATLTYCGVDVTVVRVVRGPNAGVVAGSKRAGKKSRAKGTRPARQRPNVGGHDGLS